jgi:superfamily II DNA or RNA helicase
MFVKVSGDLEITNPTEAVVKWIEENLTLTNPTYVNLIKRGKELVGRQRYVQPTIKSYVVRNGTYIVPFGCLYGLAPLFNGCERELDLAEPHSNGFEGLPCAVNLFPYQKRAVEGLIKAKGGLLKAGCGSGKTYIGIELLRRFHLRFLWICGKQDLLRQTLENINKLYPSLDIGTITDGEVRMGRDGTISTVQTMINVDRKLYENEFNIVIVDECHAVVSNPQTRAMYAKVMSRCKARFKYGLTATPTRQDGLTKLIYANIGMSPRGTFKPTAEVCDSETQSLVARYETLDLFTKDSFSYLNGDGTIDYNGLLDYLANNVERNRKIADKVKSLVDGGRKIALLSNRVSHVEKLNSILCEMGVRSKIVTGKSNKKQRQEALSNPNSWDVICSTVSLFKEGLDIKSLDTTFIALPFKDSTGIQQSEGRSERPMEGKKEPLFIFAFDNEIPYCQSVERKMRRVVCRRRK